MGKRLVHTPEGVRDIYGKEYANKQNIQKLFGEILHRYGYQAIQTPTFEFFDVFSRDHNPNARPPKQKANKHT